MVFYYSGIQTYQFFFTDDQGFWQTGYGFIGDFWTPNAIDGTDYRDHIEGGTLNDALHGHAGDDEIFGLGGNDDLMGGDGDDYLDGGNGDDFLRGGAGNDDFFGGEGHDDAHEFDGVSSFDMGAGDDWVWAYDAEKGVNQVGDVRAELGAGNDGILLQARSGIVYGGEGSDLIVVRERDVYDFFDTETPYGGKEVSSRYDLYGGADEDTFVFSNGDTEGVALFAWIRDLEAHDSIALYGFELAQDPSYGNALDTNGDGFITSGDAAVDYDKFLRAYVISATDGSSIVFDTDWGRPASADQFYLSDRDFTFEL